MYLIVCVNKTIADGCVDKIKFSMLLMLITKRAAQDIFNKSKTSLSLVYLTMKQKR